MAYGDFKDLPTKTASDKIVQEKAFNLDKNSKYWWIAKEIFNGLWFFNEKSTPFAWSDNLESEILATPDKSTSGGCIKNENILNQELGKEL